MRNNRLCSNAILRQQCRINTIVSQKKKRLAYIGIGKKAAVLVKQNSPCRIFVAVALIALSGELRKNRTVHNHSVGFIVQKTFCLILLKGNRLITFVIILRRVKNSKIHPKCSRFCFSLVIVITAKLQITVMRPGLQIKRTIACSQVYTGILICLYF